MALNSKKGHLILYHAGHYGVLSKFLIHKMDKHDKDRVIFLVDCTFASPETKIFLSEWEENNGSGCKVITYMDSKFWKNKTVDEVRHEVTDFFDELLYSLNIDIKKVDYIYSGFDGLNAFAAYLCIRGVKYVAFDLLGNTVNYRLADSLYDNKRVKYSDTAQAYLDFLREYDVLTVRSEGVSSVLFLDRSKTTSDKEYIYFDYLNILQTLPKEKKQTLKRIYGAGNVSQSKGILVPLRSYAVVKYSGVEYDRSLSLFQRFLWTYRVVVDCFFKEEDKIILKAHPNYGLPAEVIKTFPNSLYIGGHIPFDLLDAMEIDTSTFLSIGGSSSSFSKVKEQIILPEIFFSASPQIFSMYSSFIISKKVFGDECKIDIMNHGDRVRFSPFFVGLSKNSAVKSKAPSIIVVDFKKVSDEEIKNLKKLLGPYSLIIIHNPDVRTLLFDSSVSYLRIKKEEQEENCYNVMGSVVDEFIAVLYINLEYQHILNNFCYKQFMSRCGLNLIIESVVSWQQDFCKDYNKIFKIIHECAIAGDGAFMVELGRAYRDGKGVEKNLDKAVEWMKKGADKGIDRVENELFDVLQQSHKEKFSIAMASAELGDVDAMGHLGRAYRDGKGVEKDLDKAAEYFKKVADVHLNWVAEATDVMLKTNSPDNWNYAFKRCSEVANLSINVDGLIRAGAMGRLGYMYRDGKGVEKDLDKAIEWMYKAFKKHPKWEREFNEMLLKCNTFWKYE